MTWRCLPDEKGEGGDQPVPSLARMAGWVIMFGSSISISE